MFGCVVDKGVVAIDIKRKNLPTSNSNPSNFNSASVSNVQVINNQLVITGAGLDAVTNVKVNGNSLNQNFTIETKSATQIIANAVSAFSFDVSKVFNLVLSDANAAATFPIDFSLCNATLNGHGFNCAVTATDKDVLSYDQVSGKWKPRAINGLTYQGTWDAGTTEPAGSSSGDYYIVSVAAAPYAIGDWIVWNGTAYDKISNSTTITSVFGRTGAIVATKGDYDLNKLTDVDLTVPATTGKVLKFDGMKWVAGDDLSGGGAGSVTAAEIVNGAVTDAKIDTVSASKITGTLTSLQIADGAIVNADISATAAIDYSKLNIPNTTIPYAKLNIADGDIPAAKISGLPAATSVLTTSITDNDTTHAPDGNSVFDALAGKLNKTGGTLSVGTISGVPTPVNPSDVASKSYVDSAIAGYTSFTEAEVLGTDLLGLNTGVNGPITATDTVLGAMGKLQYQVTDLKANGQWVKTGSDISYSAGNVTIDKTLLLKDSASNYVEIKAPATVTSTYTLTMPPNDGSVDQVLRTDGSGVLTWVNVSDSSVQAFAKSALPTCGAGEVLKSNGTAFSCVTDASGGGAFTGTINRAVATDGSGALTSSTTTATELGYVSGVTSSIQNQLNAKEGTLTAGTTAQYYKGDKSWATLDTAAVPENTNLYFTTARAKSATVADAIADSIVDVAPSQNAVFDGLALKLNKTGGTLSVGTINGVPNPTNNDDVANKAYVDTKIAKTAIPTCGAGEVVKADGTTFTCVTDNSGAGAFSGTASRAVQTGTGGALEASAVTTTELGYVSGVTSSIQTQLNAKQGTITAGTTAQYYRGDKTFVALDTDVRATALTGLNTGVAGPITATDDVLGAFGKMQYQVTDLKGKGQWEKTGSDVYYSAGDVRIDNNLKLKDSGSNYVLIKAPSSVTSSYTLTLPTTPGTANYVLQTNGAAGVLSWAPITDASVQAFAKAALPTCGTNEVLKSNGTTLSCVTDSAGAAAFSGTINRAIASDGSGALTVSATTATELGYVNGVTSSIQAQLDAKQGTITAGTTAQYYRGDKTFATLDTAAVPENNNLYFTEPRVRATTLTGLSATSGNIAATDTVLGAFGKLLNSQSDAVTKTGNSTITGTLTVNTIVGALTVPTPINPNDAVNKSYVDGMGQWIKGTGGNAADIYRASGNVGVGTSTPGQPLEISASTSSIQMRVRRTTSSAAFADLGVDNIKGFSIWPDGYGTTSATPPFVISPTGSVGIGTTTPGAALDVNGTIRASQICDSTGANCKTVSAGWGNIAAASMVTNWPDAIICNSGADYSILFHDTRESSTGIEYYSKASGGGGHYLRFYTSNGNAYDNSAFTGYTVCTAKSIFTLISEGRTFGLLGGGVDWTPNGSNIYRSGGNVGIGTTTPGVRLQINSVSPTNSAEGHILLQGSETTGAINTGAGLTFGGSDGVNHGRAWASIQGMKENGTSTNVASYLAFATRTDGQGLAEKMRINSTGSLGIGTTAPTGLLHLNGANQNASSTPLFRITDTALSGSYFAVDNGTAASAYRIVSAGTTAKNLELQSATNSYQVFLGTSGNVGIGTNAPSAKFDVNGAASLGYLYLRPETASSEGGQLTLMGAPGYQNTNMDLYNQIIRFHSSYAGAVFNLYMDSGNLGIAGTLSQASDKRLKENIVPIKNSLDKISMLDGVYYTWKKPKLDRSHQIGLIAQDVEKIFPEVVKTDEKGWKSVAYQNLVAPIIEAIKELKTMVVSLFTKTEENHRAIASVQTEAMKQAEKIKKLEEENRKLKADMDEIKRMLNKKK